MSIHGKGLLESGLIVTAICTDCHTAHKELPPSDPESTVNPDEHRRHLRPVPRRHLRAVPAAASTRREGNPDYVQLRGHARAARTATTATRRTPMARTDVADFKLGHHGPVRPVPRGDHRDLLRHLPRQGLGAGRHDQGQVLRLPRRARHPADHRSRLARCSRDNIVGDLRQVPRGLAPAVRRLPDPRHAPRPGQVPGPVLRLLGDDRAAGRAPSPSSGCTPLAWLPRSLEAAQAAPARVATATPRAEQRSPCASRRLQRALHLMVILSFFGLAITGMMLKFSYTGWAAVRCRACWAAPTAPAGSTGSARSITFAYFVAAPRGTSVAALPTSGKSLLAVLLRPGLAWCPHWTDVARVRRRP